MSEPMTREQVERMLKGVFLIDELLEHDAALRARVMEVEDQRDRSGLARFEAESALRLQRDQLREINDTLMQQIAMLKAVPGEET